MCDVNKIKEEFKQYMIDKSMRKTQERYTILEHICLIQGHFDVEILNLRLEEHNFHVSRSSIYNTIELLMDAGFVVRHQFTSQLVQYELKIHASTHHHAICNHCGSVKEVKSEKISKEMHHVKIPKFTYKYHSFFIYGICSKCKFRIYNQKKAKMAF